LLELDVPELSPLSGEQKLTPDASTTAQPSRWQAFLNLTFASTTRGVRLVKKEHAGPLYIQKPFYPEGLEVPHVYLLHPPGGLVSGDELNVSVDIQEQCSALVTTPGAGRLYKARADGTPQTQSLNVKIADGGAFEYLPLEAIAFPNTNAVIDNNFHLTGSAKLIYWDVLSLGLPANHLSFDAGSFNQSVRVHIDERIVLQERFVINDRNRQILNEMSGLQANPVQGLLVAGPFDETPTELIEQLRNVIGQDSILAGASCAGEFIIIRSLAHCSEATRNLLEKCWVHIRPALLNREACAPRIWRT
jgi:urease accessory protein